MNNREYINTLIVAGKLERLKNQQKFQRLSINYIINILSNCDIDIQKIVNISLRKEITLYDTLEILAMITQKTDDIKSVFNELYELYKIWDRYLESKWFKGITLDLSHTISIMEDCVDSKELILKLKEFRIKEIHGNHIKLTINNKVCDINRIEDEHSYFRINNNKELYAMIIDYGERGTILLTDKDIKNNKDKLKVLNKLDKNKINAIICFADAGVNLSKEFMELWDKI